MLCSKLHCQKGFRLKHLFYKIREPEPFRQRRSTPATRTAAELHKVTPPGCCGANMAHIRQSRPDPGLGVQVKLLTTLEVVLFSLGRGPEPSRQRRSTPATRTDPAARPCQWANFLSCRHFLT